MFTPEDRLWIRSTLLGNAAVDERISGAAITGSGATDHEDTWSDIDLAFGVAADIDVPNVIADWTAHMYDEHAALHHVDLRFGPWVYRAFLLANTLQVDLGFVPAAQFRPMAETFRLVFGKANEPQNMPSPVASDLIGMGWLYALHVRSCIGRKKFWQAEYMISGVRDHALALACIRHGLPAVYGRGMDLLPTREAAPFESALVRQLDAPELSRAFRVVVHQLLFEINAADPGLGARLRPTLTLLTEESDA